ncbi:hypothetical protein GQ600_24402 [Phytophthora cactorum]|nr:hypothetical protein GQ600_24402 [Phytophthora cactorum]
MSKHASRTSSASPELEEKKRPHPEQRQLLSPSPIVAAFARTKPPPTSKPRAILICTDAAQAVVRSSVSTRVTRVSTGLCSSEHDCQTKCCSSIQVVTNLSQQRKVLRWMVKTEAQCGGKLLFPKTVDKFPSVFKSATRRANIAKATNWWRKREGYLDAARGTTVVSGRRAHGRVRVNRKSATSRDRYTSAWVTWLYPVLLDKFDRLQKAGLKFDAPLLRQLALKQFSVPSAPYTASSLLIAVVLADQAVEPSGPFEDSAAPVAASIASAVAKPDAIEEEPVSSESIPENPECGSAAPSVVADETNTETMWTTAWMHLTMITSWMRCA